MEAIFHLFLALFTIFANITVSVALSFMKAVKRTTVIFLADLAISNLVQGLISLSKAIFYIWHVNTFEGCIFTTVVLVTTAGTYITGVFFVYLDLYLSLKKMSIGRAIISKRLALIIVGVSWAVWLGIGMAGYWMRNEDFVYQDAVGCLITSGVVTREYIVLLGLIVMMSITVIMVFHVLTYRLLKKARRQQECQSESEDSGGYRLNVISNSPGRVLQSNKDRSEKCKWMRRNDAILNMILIVLITFVVCWYPVVLVSLLLVFCKPCSAYIKKELVYFLYLLVVIQYNSNGIIYLVKIKEFQIICKKFCCKCCPSQRRVAIVDSEVSVHTSFHE